ncbi:tetracycline resistance MFS efflux pump [Actinomycetes bacterium]|nr:tetracycline resistance MFS efflux pump [Actinomycetes bacterium]
MPPGFWIIWTTVALDLVGFGIVAPILGRYAERFGASGLDVGLMFASFSIAQMVFAPILGRLSDRIGRKPVIVISLVGTAIGSFITGAAGALWVLFVGRIIDGASGASVAVAQGAITDIAPPERRAQLLGMLGAAFGVGFVLGPAVGGLAALGGPHVPFYVAGVVASVNAIAAMIRLPETKKSDAVDTRSKLGAPMQLRSPLLTRYAIAGFISVTAFAGFETTFSLFGERRFGLTEGSTAAVFLLVGLMLVAVQGGAIGTLTRRWGSHTLLCIGLGVVSVGLLALGASTVWPTLIVSLALLAFGQGLVSPSITALVTDAAPPDRRGEALGYQQSVGAFARVVGPIMAGATFDHIGVAAPYLIGAALSIIAFLFIRATVTKS